MEEQDWAELGVTSRLHARKIEVNMKKYRLRHEAKAAKGDRRMARRGAAARIVD